MSSGGTGRARSENHFSYMTGSSVVDTEANCLTDECNFLFCLRQHEKVNFIRDIMLSEYYFYA